MAQLGQTPGKTPLINVRAEHYFGIPEMAEQADVLEHVVIDMLVFVPVPKVEAERVLAAVSLHTGVQCTVENTDIRIFEDSNADTEQPRESE